MRALLLVAVVMVCAAPAAAQERRLSVRVEDPSGATIPNATIIVLADSDVLTERSADGRGLATVVIGPLRQVKLVVMAAGFATAEVDVEVPEAARTHDVTVRLSLAHIETDVSVSASDQPDGGGLTQTLSQAEIDQLPDDPDDLQRMLEEIAGPGATIRVDGFTGGRLPSRDQIARIVVRRDAFSAEFHSPGRGRVEIATRPGIDRWRGNAAMNVRPSAWSARNAAAAADTRPGTLVRLNAFAAGPLVPNRVSFSGSVEGSSSEDSRGISALTLDGPFVASLAQSVDTRRASARVEGLLTPRTMFRLSYEQGRSQRGNQGVSELDLPQRGYRGESLEHEVRVSFEGGQRRPFHLRLQWDRSTASAIPDTIAPAIVVQSAFRGGGASVQGENRGQNAIGDVMVTLVARPYTLRAGSLVTYNHNTQGQLRNTLGTFTFTDLASYALGLPATFTQRRGAQPLTVGLTQAATFVQAEFALRNWNVGLGLRHELQSDIGHLGAVAPRLGVSRGFRRNTTTVRAGYGWFYDWLPVRVAEEARRLSQASSEEEVVIRNPSYPDPFASGTLSTRRDPPTRLTLDDRSSLPRWHRASIGVEHQLRQGVRLNVDTFYESTSSEFRALDLNAPLQGVRPDAALGRVLLVQSIGRSRRTGVNVDVSVAPRQRMFSSVRYGYANDMDDGADALTPPPRGTLEGEWAPSREGRHRVSWNIGVPLPRWGVVASLNGRWTSGAYYNLTTGRDDNGDAIFNDRPEGVPRNSLRAEGTGQTDLRVSWTLPSMRVNNGARLQRGPGGPGRGPGGPGGRGEQGRRFEVYFSASNVFNRVNRTGYVGVLTSPLFLQPTSAQAARRVELGWRFSF